MALTPLIKKNFIYIKRNLLKTLLELLYPCFIIGIVILSTSQGTEKYIPETTFNEYSYTISLKDNKYYNTFE
jgi:hypothetical protein